MTGLNRLRSAKLYLTVNKSFAMKKILLFGLIVWLAGCNPSKITQTWTAANRTPKQYRQILVLGVLPDTDNELQVKMEKHLVDDLKNLGYKAEAAHTVFPPGTFVKGDTSRAKTAILEKGYDAVLTIVLLDKKKEQVYIPGKITDYTYYYRYGRFDRYISEVNERIYTPGYFAEETKYIWENNFYDIGTKQLVYSARSRSFDTESKSTLAHTYGQLMVENLVSNKILLKPALPED